MSRKGSFGKRVETTTPTKDTFRVFYEMYNFKHLGQFGGELCEEQSQKIRKKEQKSLFWGNKGVKGG